MAGIAHSGLHCIFSGSSFAAEVLHGRHFLFWARCTFSGSRTHSGHWLMEWNWSLQSADCHGHAFRLQASCSLPAALH